MYFLSEKPLKSGVFADPGHVSSNSISITRGDGCIDDKEELERGQKCLEIKDF